ncbi:hypothetical protein NMY22_g2631 [Coprinellus aureogranulatus]|nr:hypothetical protein NMY22_g2631 [Coprinellus aureogranulatus]
MARTSQSNSDLPGDRLPFIETVQYHRRASDSPEEESERCTHKFLCIRRTNRLRTQSLPLPPGWNRYFHPNGDVYYRNHQLRLTTPEDIRRPTMLQYVMDAREDHLDNISDDPNFPRLPPDWELAISDVSESTAVIGMYSRLAGQAYEWREREGRLAVKHRQHFWAYVAEYPSHFPHLPPGTEEEFVAAISQAKRRLASGEVFPFTEQQIDEIIALYTRLKGAMSNASPVTGALLRLHLRCQSICPVFSSEMKSARGFAPLIAISSDDYASNRFRLSTDLLVTFTLAYSLFCRRIRRLELHMPDHRSLVIHILASDIYPSIALPITFERQPVFPTSWSAGKPSLEILGPDLLLVVLVRSSGEGKTLGPTLSIRGAQTNVHTASTSRRSPLSCPPSRTHSISAGAASSRGDVVVKGKEQRYLL